MRISHNYDIYGRTEPSIIYLAAPGKRLLYPVSGIDTSTVSLTLNTNNTAELSFTVDRYVDGEEIIGYSYLEEYMELYVDGIWFKIMSPPEITNDGMRETKNITAESYEIMLSQYKLNSFKINTGDEDSYEVMYKKNHPDIVEQYKKDNDGAEPYYSVKFYDPDNKELSFLHLVLSHANVPGWKIGYIDDVTKDDQGQLLPDGVYNFDADDTTVYSLLTQEAAANYKCIFEFDTVKMTINAYRPDSLGKDTNVVLGFRNIQNSVQISRDDSLTTKFYIDGLDGYGIASANFTEDTITDLTYFAKWPYMDETLQKKYLEWYNYRDYKPDEETDSKRETFIKIMKEYNSIEEILTELTNRVPNDSAQNDWGSMSVDYLKDAYNDSLAVIKGIEAHHLKFPGTSDTTTIDMEDLRNSSDWPLYEEYMNYVIPQIIAALQNKDVSYNASDYSDGGRFSFGLGNNIKNVNPVTLDSWDIIGNLYATLSTVELDIKNTNGSPAFGITRGVQIKFLTPGKSGICQKSINIVPGETYTLSCYVKGEGQINLEYGATGTTRKVYTSTIQDKDTWMRTYKQFTLGSDVKLVDIAFTVTGDCTFCGMQLEHGSTATQFGYFIQSENVIKAYETDWKLYGLTELKSKIETYESCIRSLESNGYSTAYDSSSEHEESYHTRQYQMYQDYKKLLKEAQDVLAERQAEYDVHKKDQDTVAKKREMLAKEVSMDMYGIEHNKDFTYHAFTEKEKYILSLLENQGTYTNENIITTTLDTTEDAVDKCKKLYDDAVEELYVESHPQYTYTDDIENIYALPDFKEYHDQLAVNDFVHLGLNDNEYVKLRVIEISYNPCDLDESMQVTFSNITQYKAKRNDYNILLNDTFNKSSHEGARVEGVNKSNTSEFVFTADVIRQLFSHPTFNSQLSGSSVASSGDVSAQKVIAELIKAPEGVFKKLSSQTIEAESATIKDLSVNAITAAIVESAIVKSKDYIDNEDSAFSKQGVWIDLMGKGRIKSPNFAVDNDGNVYATNGEFSGKITALSGKIGNFLISDGSLTNEDNSISISPTAFKYGSNFNITPAGKMSAKDAEITGSITALSGSLGGFDIASKTDTSAHYYKNTLYRIITDTNTGIQYQAGIRGASSNTDSDESAAFYVVKKENSNNPWTRENVTFPFFVRNNGTTYVENMTVGSTLYLCPSTSGFSNRQSIISFGNIKENQLTVGVMSGENITGRISFDANSINFENNRGVEILNMTVYGTRGELYKAKSCTNIDIGNSGNPFDNGYFKKLYLIDDDGNSKDVASLSQKASTSDIRLKSHIKSTSQSALPLINSIQLKEFTWKESGKHQSIGFIADELERLDPGLTYGGGETTKCVDSFYLQGYEVKAIQELSEENTHLKEIILSLEEEIEHINNKIKKMEESLC